MKQDKSSWFPILLLLLLFSSIFLFGNGNDRRFFYRAGQHDTVTSNYMAIVTNLSLEHNFYRFINRYLDGKGTHRYNTYHRFPVLGFLIIKIVILPFDNPSAQLYAARILILSFFVATAIFAYLSLCRIISDRYVSLAVILLSFSSFYLLYFNDMVTPEMMVDLFGTMLVFHGMVIFIQDGHFRQLVIKACFALLLGWHVFALLLCFIIFAFGKETFHHIVTYGDNGKRLILSMIRSQPLILGVVTLLFSMLVLGFNLATEYMAWNGEKSLTELPTWSSMLRRTGQTDAYSEILWYPYLKDQFSRIGGMVYPYYLLNQKINVQNHWSLPDLSLLGFVVFGSCLIGLFFTRHKILLATLLMFGFYWSIPFRYSVNVHSFESIFYIGIPIVFFTFCLLGLLRICGLFQNRRMITAIRFFSIASVVFIFVLSVSDMSRVRYDTESSVYRKKMQDDLDVIRKMLKNRTVLVREEIYDDLQRHDPLMNKLINFDIIFFYLSGNVILDYAKNDDYSVGGVFQSCNRLKDIWEDHAEFVLSSKLEENSKNLLTPKNDFIFLYDKPIHVRAKDSPECIAENFRLTF